MSSQYVSEAERVIADASKIIWGYVIRSFDVDSSNISPSETAFMYGAYHYSVIDILEEWHIEDEVRDVFIQSAAFFMNADPLNHDNVPVFLKMRNIVDNMINLLKADFCDSKTEPGAISIFNLRKEVLKINYSEFDIKYYIKNVKSLRAEIREGIRQAFISANSSNRAINNTKNNAHKKESFWNRYIVLILTLILFLFFAILFQINKYSYTKPVTKVPEPTESFTIDKIQKEEGYSIKNAGLTPLSRPVNKKIFRYSISSDRPHSTLEIETPYGDVDYYFVVNNLIDTSKNAKFYLYSNSTIEVNMAPGTYEIYYACGSEWYGLKYLFGDQSKCRKFKDTFTFTEECGWTVEMTPVSNGNLSSELVDVSEFPK